MEKLISIIVPVYKVEKYLDLCISSIVSQTYKNLEIILVDDGSPDNCPEICDEWVGKDCRVKVIHKENGGVSSARNAGLDIAAGEYIGFVDSDDYIEPDMYEILYNNILSYNADMCSCNFNCIDKEHNIYNLMKYKNKVIDTSKEIILNYLSDNFVDPCCHSKLYSSKIINNEKLRFEVNIKNGEDFLFNYSFFKYSKKVVAIENSLYNYYCEREGSATNVVSYDIICRWKNTKKVLLDLNDYDIYSVCIKKYGSELLCCLRELLKSNNKAFIDKYYNEITSEIKKYSKEFLELRNISKANKFSIKLISFSPKLFRIFYAFYKKTVKGSLSI